jgi:hypothetical protein
MSDQQEQETPGSLQEKLNDQTGPNLKETNETSEEDEEEEEERQVTPNSAPTNQVVPLTFDNTIEHHLDLNQSRLSYRTRHLHRLTDVDGAVISQKVNERSGIVTNLKYDIYMSEKNNVANTNYRLLQIESVVDPVTGQETSNIKHQIGEPQVQILQRMEEPYANNGQVYQGLERTDQQPRRFKTSKHIDLGSGNPGNVIKNPQTIILDTGIKIDDLNRLGDDSDLNTSSAQESDVMLSKSVRKRKSRKDRHYQQFQAKQNGHVSSLAGTQRDLNNNNLLEEADDTRSREEEVEEQPKQLSILRLLVYSFLFSVLVALVVYLALPRLIPVRCQWAKDSLLFNERSSNEDQPLPF